MNKYVDLIEMASKKYSCKFNNVDLKFIKSIDEILDQNMYDILNRENIRQYVNKKMTKHIGGIHKYISMLIGCVLYNLISIQHTYDRNHYIIEYLSKENIQSTNTTKTGQFAKLYCKLEHVVEVCSDIRCYSKICDLLHSYANSHNSTTKSDINENIVKRIEFETPTIFKDLTLIYMYICETLYNADINNSDIIECIDSYAYHNNDKIVRYKYLCKKTDNDKLVSSLELIDALSDFYTKFNMYDFTVKPTYTKLRKDCIEIMTKINGTLKLYLQSTDISDIKSRVQNMFVDEFDVMYTMKELRIKFISAYRCIYDNLKHSNISATDIIMNAISNMIYAIVTMYYMTFIVPGILYDTIPSQYYLVCKPLAL